MCAREVAEYCSTQIEYCSTAVLVLSGCTSNRPLDSHGIRLAPREGRGRPTPQCHVTSRSEPRSCAWRAATSHLASSAAVAAATARLAAAASDRRTRHAATSHLPSSAAAAAAFARLTAAATAARMAFVMGCVLELPRAPPARCDATGGDRRSPKRSKCPGAGEIAEGSPDGSKSPSRPLARSRHVPPTACGLPVELASGASARPRRA